MAQSEGRGGFEFDENLDTCLTALGLPPCLGEPAIWSAIRSSMPMTRRPLFVLRLGCRGKTYESVG
jgi:hypothetical protein